MLFVSYGHERTFDYAHTHLIKPALRGKDGDVTVVACAC